MLTAKEEQDAQGLGLLTARNHSRRFPVQPGQWGATRKDGTRPTTVFDVAHTARDTARGYGWTEEAAQAASLVAFNEALELGFSTSLR